MSDSTNIDVKVVHKIAHLARLSISEQDENKYAQQLTNIFHLIAQLDEVNTDHVAPMYSAHAMAQRFREDVITETPSTEQEQFQLREEMLSNAKDKEIGLFMVPKVIPDAG